MWLAHAQQNILTSQPILLTLKETINREISGFQVTGMIEWGQKSKPQKIPVPKFNSPENPMLNYRAIKFPENHRKSSDCFE